MKLLLDTHIWIWSLHSQERLGVQVRKHLRDPKNELWLSPISMWEAVMLHERRRLDLIGDFDDWVAKAAAPFREAPLTLAIAALAARLPMPQRDPADRFLAATAQVLGLTLVTADTKLLGLGEIATLANR